MENKEMSNLSVKEKEILYCDNQVNNDKEFNIVILKQPSIVKFLSLTSDLKSRINK